MFHEISRIRQVERTTGMARSTIYRKIANGSFPKPISLGDRAVGWLAADIQSWLEERIAESKGAGHE